MKKYELTTETKTFLGRKLFRIKALRSFGNVKIGELGGYIEKEENLSQDGNSWVCADARVYGNAEVCGDAWVFGDAQVSGDARVYGNAEVCGNSWVSGDADYMCIKGLGSCNRNTTFFRCKACVDDYEDECGECEECPLRWVKLAPIVEAEFVKHGEWKKIQNFAKCSNCMHGVNWGSKDFLSPYCPNCGAKMDGTVGTRL